MTNTEKIKIVEKRCCDLFGIDYRSYKANKTRECKIITIRQFVFKASYENMKISYKELASLVGGKNHATAINAIKRITGYMQYDKELKALYLKFVDSCSDVFAKVKTAYIIGDPVTDLYYHAEEKLIEQGYEISGTSDEKLAAINYYREMLPKLVHAEDIFLVDNTIPFTDIELTVAQVLGKNVVEY